MKEYNEFADMFQESYDDAMELIKSKLFVIHYTPKNWREMKYLMNNERLHTMKEYKPTFGEYKEFDEASEEYIFDRLEEWAKSVIYMHHRKKDYLYVNSFCWIDSDDTHYLTAFFRSNDILEKLDEIEEVKLSYILPNRSNRP